MPIPTLLPDESTNKVSVSTVRSPVIVKEDNVPTLVKDDANIPELRVFEVNTVVPLIAKLVPRFNTPLTFNKSAIVVEASIITLEEANKFEVVIVPVAVMFATLEILPERKAFPWTAKVAEGDVVPMPT